MIGTPFIASTTIFLLAVIGTTLCWSLPKNVCTSPYALKNTNNPTTVVGNGVLGSCTQSALAAALSKGGIIKFNCGSGGSPVTIPIVSPLTVSTNNDTVIDGGGIVTLDGTGTTRIMIFDRGDFRYATPRFSAQRLRFINGRCQDSDGGCAIFQKNGGSTFIHSCRFENNTGPTVGQDVAGGAVWTIGGGETTVISSVFIGNKCSNGGGLGILGSGLIIYNSHFENNQATGNGGNPGNGGNGGAISFDGAGRNNTICGTRFTKNQGNKYGGAFFRVSYNGNETNNLDNLLADGNLITVAGSGLAGGFYIQGGTVSIRNTTIANNSATGAGGVFFSSDNAVTLNGVNIIENQAYSALGGAIFCSNPVTGTFSGLTVANNYAGAFAGSFAFCTATIALTNSIIANSLVGNTYPANACTDVMSNGIGVVQSPINKLLPATGLDPSCANSATRTNNVTVVLNKTTWKITVTGAQPVYSGSNIVPGL